MKVILAALVVALAVILAGSWSSSQASDDGYEWNDVRDAFETEFGTTQCRWVRYRFAEAVTLLARAWKVGELAEIEFLQKNAAELASMKTANCDH